MTTDFYTFNEDLTVQEALAELRRLRPEPSHIYSVIVTDRHNRFLSSVSLGELVVAEPDRRLKEVMNKHAVSVFDDDKTDSLAELVAKYNLLAVPVINKNREMEGIIVVEDIVEDLLKHRKTR